MPVIQFVRREWVSIFLLEIVLTLRIVMSSAVQYSLTFQHITIALVLLRPVLFHHLVFQFIHQVLCHHSRWISFCLLLPSHLNIPHWCHYLSHYQDAQICDFLEYGCPAGYDYLSFGFPQCQLRNHRRVLFPDAINSHLSTESGWHAVVGYFGMNPFSCPVALSPLNSVPKDSTKRCIVIDLSWPAGSSMNNGISSSSYLGEEISLTYLTVDNIASLIWSTGAGCLIYKQNLIRAYCQFPVDPQDYPLLEYCWNHDLYFDAFLPMGLR